MQAVLFLGLTLAAMVVLIRLRVHVGYALVAGAVLIGALFSEHWGPWPGGTLATAGRLARHLGEAAIGANGLQLLGLVLLITFLGHVLKHVESLARLVALLKSLFRDRRVAMVVAPAFVGLLPMPGGAAFSAPMVGELTDDVRAPREDRTLINFWFRHIWEWTWPLYPGVLVASQLTGAPLEKIMLAHLPCTVGAVAVGALFFFRRVELPDGAGERRAAGGWCELLGAVWPVAAIIGLFGLFVVAKNLGRHVGLPTDRGLLAMDTKAALLWTLAGVIPLFLLQKRVTLRDTARLVRATVTVKLVVLVFGVVAFGHMLRTYRAVETLPATFKSWGIPAELLLFVVPMIAGLLMGYMPGVVAASFPVLIPLLVDPQTMTIHYGRILFAYAGGFLGVLTSPVHLCLVLSREYFEADLGRVYRRLIPAAAVLALVAAVFLVLWEAVAFQ